MAFHQKSSRRCYDVDLVKVLLVLVVDPSKIPVKYCCFVRYPLSFSLFFHVLRASPSNRRILKSVRLESVRALFIQSISYYQSIIHTVSFCVGCQYSASWYQRKRGLRLNDFATSVCRSKWKPAKHPGTTPMGTAATRMIVSAKWTMHRAQWWRFSTTGWARHLYRIDKNTKNDCWPSRLRRITPSRRVFLRSFALGLGKSKRYVVCFFLSERKIYVFVRFL